METHVEIYTGDGNYRLPADKIVDFRIALHQPNPGWFDFTDIFGDSMTIRLSSVTGYGIVTEDARRKMYEFNAYDDKLKREAESSIQSWE